MYMQYACPSVGQVFSLAAEYVIIEENEESVSHTVRGKGGASCSDDMFL